VILFYR